MHACIVSIREFSYANMCAICPYNRDATQKHTDGVDFSSATTNVTLSPTHRSSLVSIEIINDSVTEADETFTLHLTTFSPIVLIDTPNATVTIVDDDSTILTSFGACISVK